MAFTNCQAASVPDTRPERQRPLLLLLRGAGLAPWWTHGGRRCPRGPVPQGEVGLCFCKSATVAPAHRRCCARTQPAAGAWRPGAPWVRCRGTGSSLPSLCLRWVGSAACPPGGQHSQAPVPQGSCRLSPSALTPASLARPLPHSSNPFSILSYKTHLETRPLLPSVSGFCTSSHLSARRPRTPALLQRRLRGHTQGVLLSRPARAPPGPPSPTLSGLPCRCHGGVSFLRTDTARGQGSHARPDLRRQRSGICKTQVNTPISQEAWREKTYVMKVFFT